MFGRKKKATTKKAPAKKAAPKKRVTKKNVPCVDCRPRRDDITDRSSGLVDAETICPTCNGSGQVKE